MASPAGYMLQVRVRFKDVHMGDGALVMSRCECEPNLAHIRTHPHTETESA